MLAEQFSNEEAPTRPFGQVSSDRPSLATTRPPMRLMLVNSPVLPDRGLVWIHQNPELSFDAKDLQRIMRLERLNLG